MNGRIESPIETIEASVYRRLDAMRGDIIKLTQDMVAYKSVNPRFMADPENSQESEVQDYIESKLKALGLEITRWEAEARRPNLVARRRGGAAAAADRAWHLTGILTSCLSATWAVGIMTPGAVTLPMASSTAAEQLT